MGRWERIYVQDGRRAGWGPGLCPGQWGGGCWAEASHGGWGPADEAGCPSTGAQKRASPAQCPAAPCLPPCPCVCASSTVAVCVATSPSGTCATRSSSPSVPAAAPSGGTLTPTPTPSLSGSLGLQGGSRACCPHSGGRTITVAGERFHMVQNVSMAVHHIGRQPTVSGAGAGGGGVAGSPRSAASLHLSP